MSIAAPATSEPAVVDPVAAPIVGAGLAGLTVALSEPKGPSGTNLISDQ